MYLTSSDNSPFGFDLAGPIDASALRRSSHSACHPATRTKSSVRHGAAAQNRRRMRLGPLSLHAHARRPPHAGDAAGVAAGRRHPLDPADALPGPLRLHRRHRPDALRPRHRLGLCEPDGDFCTPPLLRLALVSGKHIQIHIGLHLVQWWLLPLQPGEQPASLADWVADQFTGAEA